MRTNVPATWDTKTGAGIAWKVPSPTSGFNSPIVWGDRVFLSGGDAQAARGRLPGRQDRPDPLAATGGKRPRRVRRRLTEVPESTGYAAPTMATDGRRVYVIFANGDCAAFTLEGKLGLVQELWRAEEPLRPRHLAGHLAGPADRATRPGRPRRQQIQALRAGRAHRPGRLAAPAQSGRFLGAAPSSSRPPGKRR